MNPEKEKETVSPHEKRDEFEMQKWMSFSEKIGGLESRVTGLERRIDDRLAAQSKELDELKRSQVDSNRKLDEMLQIMHKGQGGWKVITAIGAVLVSISAGAAWLFERMTG